MTQSPAPEVLRAAGLELRPDEYAAYAGGRFLALSRRELSLLAVLMRNPGRIVTREDLYAMAWGGELRNGDRSVDVYVHKLRGKLERALPRWTFIHTHMTYGYRFSPEPAAPAGNGPVTTA